MSSSKKATSKPAKEVRQYTTGDPVLGKMRGYPPWPGIIVDPADAPPAVQQQQPPNKKASAYCILFFPMGDYGWLNPKELSFLQRHEIEAFLADDAKKRNGDLREGYRIALDPQPWLAARIAAEAAMQDAEDNAQVDQLAPSDPDDDDADPDAPAERTSPEDDDDRAEEGDGAPKKKSRKRKREGEPAEPKPKKEKGPAKPKAPKKASAEPKPKKGGASSAPAGEKKPRKSSAKSRAVVESEDDAAGAGIGSGAREDLDGPLSAAPAVLNKKDLASPPPTKKARRDPKEDDDDSKHPGDQQSFKVRDWRHKLQKTFLSPKSAPKPEAMAEFDVLFTTVEQYDEITIEQLQFSKIGKVMRHIAALQDDKIPPRDEEYAFRARAKGLVDKWQRILNANKPGGAGGGGEEAREKPEKVNGSRKKPEVRTVEEGVAGVDLNGKGDDSPTVTTAAALGVESPVTPAVHVEQATAPAATSSGAAGAADAEGEHDQDANADPEDASTHAEGDVVMADA